MSERIGTIPSIGFSQFPSILKEAALEANVGVQEKVLSLCLQRILSSLDPSAGVREPRAEQVRVLRRLVFCKSDVLLVARTGFGKSLIFHAFSVLTGKITLQIIPLSKLGDEQLNDIQKLPGAKPCLITHEIKRTQSKLFDQIREGEYTHILLGPEQASSKEFRRVMKAVSFQNRIGLVAIDECHLVKQWNEFRPAFSMICQLRSILPQDVVWFGCSATLDATAEKLVLSQAGFRVQGPRMYQTEVIRTSIDRPDVAIHLQPLRRGRIATFDSLYFLLDRSVDSAGSATPAQIPKTVVFVDGRVKVQKAAGCLQTMLLQKTDGTAESGQRYGLDNERSRYCVTSVVETFTSHVSRHDRDFRYSEFKKEDSRIRILVATTSLGMGVNIPDIERVVLWSFPLGDDPADHWQRLGRGGRGPGRTSTCYLLLPYWAFDSKGKEVSTGVQRPEDVGEWSRSLQKFAEDPRRSQTIPDDPRRLTFA